jgi:subtilisin family serine protease
MKKIYFLLFIAFLWNNSPVFSQTISRDIIICYPINSPTSGFINYYQRIADSCAKYNVILQKIDSLTCVPNTFWIKLTGHQNDVLAVVEGIKRIPPQDNPMEPMKPENMLDTAKTKSWLPRTDTIPLFDNNCVPAPSTVLKPVLVALIDGGLEAFSVTNPKSHTAYFAPYLWHYKETQTIGYDFTRANPNTYPIDSAGHGTNMAGLIVDMFQRFKVSNAKLMILKTQNQSGNGRLWDVFRAIDKAVCNNAQIINISLSGTTAKDPDNDGALNTLIKWLGVSKGILVVAAAGNDGMNVSVGNKMYYAGSFSQPNLIKVAALMPTGNTLWPMSNYGTTIDIAAPGVDIPCIQPLGDSVLRSGTSLSTAYVTAVAAILAGYRKTQTFDYLPVKTAILQGATKSLLGSHNVSSNGWVNTCRALVYFKTH